jgi:hypothetical protein
MNTTARTLYSGSALGGEEYKKLNRSPYIKSKLTGSKWTPYVTQIHFHERMGDEPILIGSFPRPIKMRDDLDIIFKIQYDY